MNVRELTDPDAAAWDALVVASAEGLPLQLAGWRAVIAASFGVEPRYLIARDAEGRAAGVLPLYLVRSRLTGRAARSMPGGLCAATPEAAAALLAAAEPLARAAGMARLELHDTRVVWPGLATASDHLARRVPMPPRADALWEQLDRNVRRQIRMAEQNGLAARTVWGVGDLDAFYEVLRRVTHALGAPVFGRDFLERAVAAFPGRCSTTVVRLDAAPVAGYFQMALGATLCGLWGGALATARDQRAGYLALWAIMRDAAERGLAWLDMGRSPRDSGAAAFKAQWGGDARPVYQQALRLDGRAAASPGAPGAGYGGAARWWARLPLAVATALGPQVRRHIPFG